MATKQDILNLKIHKLTQDQYDEAFAAGQIDPNAIYLTPEEVIDLSEYLTKLNAANTYLTKEEMETIKEEVTSVLNSKQATITGAATTITSNNLTTNRALISDSSGKVGVSAVTSTELGYLDGVTSNIQTQLNNKQATITGSASTIATNNLTANRVLICDGLKKVNVSTVTSTELTYLDGVTSNIQTQLNKKEPTITTLPISKGGTGATAFTQNRPLFYNGTNLISSSHYIEGQKLGVNTIYAPEQPFFVNGQVHFASGPANSCTTGTIHIPTYYRGSSSAYLTFDLGKRDSSRMIMIEVKGNGYNGGYPIHSMYQFYNYTNKGVWSILAYKGRCYGDPTGPLKIYYKDIENADGTTETRLMACLCPALDSSGNIITSNSSQTLDISIQYSASHLDKATMTVGTVDPSTDDTITILQTIIPVDATPVSNGGTGATTFTANRLLNYNGSKLIATNHYLADGKLAINSTTAPTENLYVNGTGKITGASTLAGAVTMSSTATIAGITKITNVTDSTATTNGALVVTGGIGIGKTLRVANDAVVTGKIVAGTNGTAVTENKLTIYGQSQFNGNAAITDALSVGGATTVKTLTISDATGIGHLNFSRSDAPNYIRAPYNIGFNVGKDLSLENCSLVVGNTYISPGETGGSSLGTSSKIWKQAFVEHYQLYDSTNKTVGGQFYTTNSTSTTAQPTYLMIGNSIATGTTGSRYGVLRLYGTGANYTDIRRSAETTSYTLNLPGDNGQLVYHTNDTQIGSASTPIYIAASGQATAITSVDVAHGGTGATTAAAARTNLGLEHFNKEAYLTWGGKNLAGSYGPIDGALIPDLGANRFAFMPTSGIFVEYSRDNGTTWIDYAPSDSEKSNLFNGNSANFRIGADTTGNKDKSQYMVRMTLTQSSCNLYTVLNKFIIFISTEGSSGSYCSIEARTSKNYKDGVNTWVNFADKVGISGYSGYNVINTSEITFGAGDTQYGQIRFTFGVTSHPSTTSAAGLRIAKIFGIGGMGWSTPSRMAANGHLYSYDWEQNAHFPKKLTLNNGGTIGDETLYVNGTSKITGATTVKTLTISDTTAIGHLNFSRTGAPNYVVAPDKIAFNVGSSLSLETCALVVASNYVVPGASKYSTLGTENNLWKGVYAANVRANSFDAKGQQENQIRAWHSENETDALYLFGNQDGRRGLYDTEIGSIISIGPDYVNFNSYKSTGQSWAKGRHVASFKATFVPDRTSNIYSSFYPVLSRKTYSGSWDIGCLMPGSNAVNADGTYNAGDMPSAAHNKLYHEAFHFIYSDDSTYASGTYTAPVKIYSNGLVHASKLAITASGYGTDDPAASSDSNPVFTGQLYFKIIE